MQTEHVVFGTGAIGRAVMQELVERGETVRMVNQSGQMPETPSGVEVIAADLYDPANVRHAAGGARVIYQCAQPGYTRWQQDFPRLQNAILDGLTNTGVKLVLVENLYMYGKANGHPMTENTPHNPASRKGRVRSEISEVAFSAHRQGQVRVTAARGSDYFGPWGTESAMGARVFYPLLEGKAAQLIGRLDLPHTLTYTGDFGRAMVILGEDDRADGHAWHVPNAEPSIPQGEFVRRAADESGVDPKMNCMGAFMMRLGGLFVPEARESVEMMYEFEEAFIVDSSRFEQTFGMQASPLNQSIRETLAWYRTHPQG
jgi:nucleoside-diphosphate-sugar epimerase